VSTPSEFPVQPAPRPWPLSPEPEPVFGLIEVFCTFLAVLFTMLFCAAVAIGVAHHVSSLQRIPVPDLADEPRVMLPAQLAAYLMVLGLLWRLFSHHFRIGFFRALAWRWPSRWSWFLASGALLAVAVELSSNFLPAPPQMPIDKMLRTTADAWMMSFFGVFIAPFAEEVLFRGLLFPALARRAGALFSFVVTSVLFGAIHAQQLAGAWIQVSCIVLVGAVLTAIRWRFRSLASSTLVHVGYNGALFFALFLQTRGFTSFPAK
jgi:hypothetical protein